MVLTRAGETTLVLAKHCRSDRVGVQLVGELCDVQAARSMFVAMGRYTADTRQFGA